MHFTILLRGGWSIGNVLERYFSQADHGDKLIANILSGRNFFTKNFSRLIPHFKPDKNLKPEVQPKRELPFVGCTKLEKIL